MKSPEPVLCLNLFSPDFIDCAMAMPPELFGTEDVIIDEFFVRKYVYETTMT
jgi:hypothetical protein